MSELHHRGGDDLPGPERHGGGDTGGGGVWDPVVARSADGARLRMRDFELPDDAQPRSGVGVDVAPSRAGDVEPDADRTPEGHAWIPACRRAEWQDPIRDGSVDQIGQGVVDERARRFSPDERAIGDYIAGRDGVAVVALAEDSRGGEPNPDADIDGTATEFKTLYAGCDSAVNNALLRAKSQADHAVIDGRSIDLPRPEAEKGLSRYVGSPYVDRLETARIIGRGYELPWNRKDNGHGA